MKFPFAMAYFLSSLLLGLMHQGELLAQASERTWQTIELVPTPVTLSPGASLELRIDGYRHVKRLVVSATGIAHEAIFEVLANGDVKGTIHVPGSDPAYVVTIAEATSALVFRHVSGARVQINSVKADVSEDVFNPGDGMGPFDRGTATEISRRCITAADRLHPWTSQADWETYVLPIKVAAGRAYALSSASGDMSRRVRESLLALLAQIVMANPYIDRALQADATFDLAVAVLTERNRLEDLMD